MEIQKPRRRETGRGKLRAMTIVEDIRAALVDIGPDPLRGADSIKTHPRWAREVLATFRQQDNPAIMPMGLVRIVTDTTMADEWFIGLLIRRGKIIGFIDRTGLCFVDDPEST